VPLVAASAQAIPWPSASFDAVVADSLLEHLADPRAALRECARVLRPGGRLILWSPNRLSLLADPHVGLWGLGWLPRRWASAYVRSRRGCSWPINLLSPQQAYRLALACGFTHVQSEAPDLTPPEIAASPHSEAWPLRLYGLARRLAPTRAVLRRFGPLW
jgi:SAM-dependent methyltransferase